MFFFIGFVVDGPEYSRIGLVFWHTHTGAMSEPPDWGDSGGPSGEGSRRFYIWEFPTIGVPFWGVLIIRILLFGVLY